MANLKWKSAIVRAIAIACLIFVMGMPAYAAEEEQTERCVVTTITELQQAISDAEDGDVIYISVPIFVYDVPKEIGAPDKTVILRRDPDSEFDWSVEILIETFDDDILFRNLVFDGGESYHAAIRLNGPAVLENVQFIGVDTNFVPIDIYCGTTVIRNCVFDGNSNFYSGCIRTSEYAHLEVYDSVFMDNSAEQGPGAIHNDGEDLVVMRSTFTGNSGTVGTVLTTRSAALTDCTIVDNTAGRCGAGFYALTDLYSTDAMTLTDCIVYGNSAPQFADDIFSTARLTIQFTGDVGELYAWSGKTPYGWLMDSSAERTGAIPYTYKELATEHDPNTGFFNGKMLFEEDIPDYFPETEEPQEEFEEEPEDPGEETEEQAHTEELDAGSGDEDEEAVVQTDLDESEEFIEQNQGEDGDPDTGEEDHQEPDPSVPVVFAIEQPPGEEPEPPATPQEQEVTEPEYKPARRPTYTYPEYTGPVTQTVTREPEPEPEKKTEEQKTEQPASKPLLVCGSAVIDCSRVVILRGYGDGKIHESDPLTRAQMAVILCRLLDDNSQQLLDNPASRFKDVSPDAWYTPYLLGLADAGVIAGTGNGCCSPDTLTTWGQLLTMMMRFSGYNACEYQRIQYDGWAKPAIETAVANGWIADVYGFDPDAVITRGEAANLVNTVIQNAKYESEVVRYEVSGGRNLPAVWP